MLFGEGNGWFIIGNHMYHAEQEKRDAKGNSLYESLYMKFENTHL
jgi:hypothetical protein